MMKKSICLAFLLLGILGCSTEKRNEGATPTASALTVINTESPSTIQPSPTVFATQTPPVLEVKRECLEVRLQAEKGTNGVFVFQKEFGSPLVFLDSGTQNQQFVPDDPNMQVLSAYVSPNGKLLFYELDLGDRSGVHKLILTQADGITQREIPYYGDWSWSSIFWLNDSTLRVAEVDDAITYLNNFAFNPFTDMKVPLQSDFPDIVGEGIDWGTDRNAIELGIAKGINIIYNPTLTLALYPKGKDSISLFSLQTNQEIAQLTIPGEAYLPKWSPDGTKLAVIGTDRDSVNDSQFDEFLIIDRDGTITSQFPYQETFAQSTYVENYSWSPDGSRIAFWVKTDHDPAANAKNPFELAVLDLQTNKLTNYCISGTSTIEYETYTNTVNIIWSPDGTQLLIIRYNDDNNENIDDIVVNLTNKTAYKVAVNMQPIGWMTLEP